MCTMLYLLGCEVGGVQWLSGLEAVFVLLGHAHDDHLLRRRER